MNSTDPTASPPNTPTRRHWIMSAAALAGSVLAGGQASAQAHWPERAVRFIVPFPPGGNSDALARILADRLRDVLKGNIVVDNRPGGTTQVGSEAAARAEPDGYTMLLVTATTFTVLPNLRKLSFDLNSFEIAGGVADYVPIVTARTGLGVKSLPELIALARRQPGKLTWGSAGVASAGHIYGEILKRHAGIDMLHVPFKGSGELVAGLLGGQVDLIIDGVGLGLARNGKAVALATFFDKRHPDLPDVPAIPETGVKLELPAGGWGIGFPKGTPRPIVEATSAALEKILVEPDTREKLLRASVVAQWLPAAGYRAALGKARAYYAELLPAIGMKQES
ncbi:MAG TPA: tripartite tricarboxylate transporter substrate binding protein [Burkholderiaceae bacterium]|nr:tripartite tricarboxylate transporter substrate binding protein [Burkholderiaceae bacterium]